MTDQTKAPGLSNALIHAIGEYGFAVRNSRNEAEITHRWLELIGAIKAALASQDPATAPVVPAEVERLREALTLAQRLCSETLPKFNWGASALDANAIHLLNTVPGVIDAALKGQQ